MGNASRAWCPAWKEYRTDAAAVSTVKQTRCSTVVFLIGETRHITGGLDDDGIICVSHASYSPSVLPYSLGLRRHSHIYVADKFAQVWSERFDGKFAL